MSDEPNGSSTEESEQSDATSTDSSEPSTERSDAGEQSTAQSDDQQTGETDQSAEQSSETPTDQSEQPSEESSRSDSQAGEQSEQSTPESDQPAEATSQQATSEGSSSETAAGQPATTGELNAKRQSMLDLIDKWMPTSLNNPRVPDGETQDLMAKAGWTKATGQYNKKVKDDGGRPATSCGDILATMLKLWRSNFVGAFGIRDVAVGNGPGAKKLGYYVEADGAQSPEPGDIIVLRNGVGKGSTGTVGHVGILVEAGESEWRTADGGGGALPDQTASVSTRTVRFENGVAILKSPTDLKEKQLDGWVDLDKLEQTE
jgi:hypothetical protein